MSKAVKWYCDHCGKEISEMHDYTEYNITLCDRILKADLCNACLSEMESKIKKFIGEEDD